ncbi:MAG: polyprenyl synthetase family protein [Bacteroidales bacterium]|nr:polyprenyl synthetase family protein [Bacteroidales bacterium]
MEQIISPIATEMARFEAFFAQTLKADTEPMDSIMRYVQETKGKRLRPILVLLSAKLFGEPNALTMRAAAFAEMVHSATLIHDDVVDGDDQRRGRASVKARFDSRSAVLAGDYLLAKAMLLIANDTAVLNEMLHTATAMSEGELMQGSVGLSYHGSRNDNPNESGCHNVTALQTHYLDIITRKTAMLMQSSCKAGAMSVEASPEQIKKTADFGLLVGQVFQMRDDILDGENTELAKTLLPNRLEKAMKALEGFPPNETVEALRELTQFCAKRKQ